MFFLGVLVGVVLSTTPWFISFHRACCAIDPNNTLRRSLKTVGEMAALYVEQYLRKSIVYDKVTKRHVLSFVLGKKLHRVYVKQAVGPESRNVKDPFDRGYMAIQPRPTRLKE